MPILACGLNHILQRMRFLRSQISHSNQFHQRDCLFASKTTEVNCLVSNILFGPFTCDLLTSETNLDHLLEFRKVDRLLRNFLICKLEQEFQSIVCVDLQNGLLIESCINQLDSNWNLLLIYAGIHKLEGDWDLFLKHSSIQ